MCDQTATLIRLEYDEKQDHVHGGRLPTHVHCVMDEFANVALPDEFDKLLATMRSREISVSIIIQNIAQLKALFEKQWETLTTESAAVFMPFRVQEVFDKGGIYCGKNAISGNMIVVNKSTLMNGSSFHFGIPGSGKSFGCKDEMTQLALNTDDDILVCDPEREYGFLREFGAEIIHIAAGSPDHINAMDMVEGYSDTKNPIAQKSQFIMSLLEQLDQTRELTSMDKSIIDRCTGDLYKNYRNGGPLPTLPALRELLLAQPEPEARDLALSLELFTEGSLNAFAYPTNVNTQCRILVYDILDLGEQLKTMGLLVITDAILNRVTENWKAGRRTHVYLDEFHVVYENPYSSMFFTSAWRRFRKRKPRAQLGGCGGRVCHKGWRRRGKSFRCYHDDARKY